MPAMPSTWQPDADLAGEQCVHRVAGVTLAKHGLAARHPPLGQLRPQHFEFGRVEARTEQSLLQLERNLGTDRQGEATRGARLPRLPWPGRRQGRTVHPPELPSHPCLAGSGLRPSPGARPAISIFLPESRRCSATCSSTRAPLASISETRSKSNDDAVGRMRPPRDLLVGRFGSSEEQRAVEFHERNAACRSSTQHGDSAAGRTLRELRRRRSPPAGPAPCSCCG